MVDIISDTAVVIETDLIRMDCLRAVRELNLPDWFIAAGFVRNAIWDHIHDLPMTSLNDIDVVYFDRNDSFISNRSTLCSIIMPAISTI